MPRDRTVNHGVDAFFPSRVRWARLIGALQKVYPTRADRRSRQRNAPQHANSTECLCKISVAYPNYRSEDWGVPI